MRIAFTTLGCKINQFETDALRQDFETRGSTIVPFNAEADVYVINTCSVTAKSDYQCRQAIRSAVRRGQGAKVVVTGCYAELQPEEIKKIAGVDLVLGARDKNKIPDLLLGAVSTLSGRGPSGKSTETARIVRSRTRGYLKIQDGCDNTCAYCVVPLARGSSRSSSVEGVVQEFGRSVQAGCPEVVLTGIHIGKYGADLSPNSSLTDLLKQLIPLQGNTRIRLSSIEPGEITDEMIGLLGRGLCRHLHIPLQSGDDTILRAMQRTYSSDFYQSLLENIAKQVPGVALGADVMVGFPGEGEREFQNTMRLVAESPLTHLHVFSYSRRPGTIAADMPGQVPEEIKKVRSESLRQLAKDKNMSFQRAQLGKELDVVVESRIDARTGCLTGLTDNYIRVHIFNAKKESVGKKVLVRLSEAKEQDIYAVIL